MTGHMGTLLTWLGVSAFLAGFVLIGASLWVDDPRVLLTGCVAILGGAFSACIGMTINA